MALHYPSKKGSQVLRLLEKIGYSIERQKGSHRILVAEGRPRLVFAWHDSAGVPPAALKNLLVKQVGLSEEEIAELL